MMNNKFKKYLTIIALGMAAGAVFYMPYIRYILYDAQIQSMGVTNTQSGYLLTAYAILNIFLLIPGGILADKISTRKAVSYSCVATGLLGFVYLFTMKNLLISLLVWVGFGISTGFVLWSAIYRTVRIIGTEDEQGFLYGFYYACNGLSCAVINMVGVYIYGTGSSVENGFFRACLFGAIAPIVIAGILMILLKDVDQSVQMNDGEPKFNKADVKILVKNPTLWLIAAVLMIGYIFYSSTSYFTPYLTEVMGVSIVNSGFLSAVRTYLLLLLTPIGGWIADRVFHSTSRWLTVAFVILTAMFLAMFVMPPDVSSLFVTIYTLIPSAVVMMSYGLIASLISEAKIPKALTGTAVGIVSAIGYSPDAWCSILFGSWLDKFQANGYLLIFGFLATCGIVAAILCIFLYRRMKKAEQLVESEQLAIS